MTTLLSSESWDYVVFLGNGKTASEVLSFEGFKEKPEAVFYEVAKKKEAVSAKKELVLTKGTVVRSTSLFFLLISSIV